MNSLKITYMILTTISMFLFLAVAIVAPILITPGYYWWTAFCIFMIFASSHGFTSRLNTWDAMGKIDI